METRIAEAIGVKLPRKRQNDENLPEKDQDTGASTSGTSEEYAPGLDPLESTLVHPYIGILFLNRKHPLILMHDAGDSLYDLIYAPGSRYRLEWQQSTALRAAFLVQVGFSALNLVHQIGLCHNDIRLPNIVVREGKFCLIDFDLSRLSILYQPKSSFSPPLESAGCAWQDGEMEMCYSVAQIAVNVFILSAPTQFCLSDVTESEIIWSEQRDAASQVDRQFEDWAQTKGGLPLEFVSSVRAACREDPGLEEARLFPPNFRRYFMDVLRHMLS